MGPFSHLLEWVKLTPRHVLILWDKGENPLKGYGFFGLRVLHPPLDVPPRNCGSVLKSVIVRQKEAELIAWVGTGSWLGK